MPPPSTPPSFVRNAAGLASQLRITALTEQALEWIGLLSPVDPVKTSGIRDEVVRIPVHAVGPDAYTRDDAFQRQVLAHYESSLSAMVDMAAEARAWLLFVTPLSNLRDFAPFKSENRGGLTAQQLRTW
jgi:hypothetical protein